MHTLYKYITGGIRLHIASNTQLILPEVIISVNLSQHHSIVPQNAD